MTAWAERVRRFMDDGIDVYGYFNNHFAGHSPASVRLFEEILHRSPQAAKSRTRLESPLGGQS